MLKACPALRSGVRHQVWGWHGGEGFVCAPPGRALLCVDSHLQCSAQQEAQVGCPQPPCLCLSHLCLCLWTGDCSLSSISWAAKHEVLPCKSSRHVDNCISEGAGGMGSLAPVLSASAWSDVCGGHCKVEGQSSGQVCACFILVLQDYSGGCVSWADRCTAGEGDGSSQVL